MNRINRFSRDPWNKLSDAKNLTNYHDFSFYPHPNTKSSKGSRDVKGVMCHGFIAALFSPVVKQTLMRGLKSISLKGASKAQMRCVVDYFYNGTIVIPFEEVKDFINIATYLELSELHNYCIETLEKSGYQYINENNYLDWYKVGNGHSDDVLRNVDNFVLSEFEDFAESGKLLKLDTDTLARILQNSNMNVRREDTVLQAVIDWLYVKQKTLSKDDLKDAGNKLITCVRVEQCSASQLLKLFLHCPAPLSKSAQNWLHERCIVKLLSLAADETSELMDTSEPRQYEQATTDSITSTPVVYTFPNHTDHLSNLRDVFDRDIGTDIALTTDDGSVIKCHKVVLHATSKYFKTFFTSKTTGNKLRTMFLNDVSMTGISELVNYLYYGELNLTPLNVSEVLRASKQVELENLSGDCMHYMKHGMIPTNDNVVECLNVANENRMPILYNTAMFQIRYAFTELTESKALNDLLGDTMKELLQSDHLNVLNEDTVFQCLHQWSEQCVNEYKIQSLFKLIRFSELSEEYLYNFVQHLPIMNAPPFANKVSNAIFNYQADESERVHQERTRGWPMLISRAGNRARFNVYNPLEKNWNNTLSGPEWATDSTFVTRYRSCDMGILMVKKDKVALLITKKNHVQEFPDLPFDLGSEAVLCNNKVVVFPGKWPDNNSIFLEPVPFWINTDAQGTWKPTAPMPHPVSLPITQAVGNLIYAIGGNYNNRDPRYYVQIYNTTTDTWKLVSNIGVDPAMYKPILYDNTVTLISRARCVMYNPHDDTWQFYKNIRVCDRFSVVNYGGCLVICSDRCHDPSNEAAVWSYQPGYGNQWKPFRMDVTGLKLPYHFFHAPAV